jgi:hypothetical protein
MNKQKQPHRRGPKPKDEALVLRDQYWALFVKSKFPDESYASLERVLYPHLKITRREDSLGYSQPCTPSKIARGKHGLSRTLGALPAVVERAEALVPGAIEAFTSILWTALMPPLMSTHDGDRRGSISIEVTSRLNARHFAPKSAVHAGLGLLNVQGIRRLSRLRHLDALGLLLCYCPVHMKPSKLSLTAEAYVLYLLQRCCDKDPGLMAIKSSLIKLLSARFRIQANTRCSYAGKVFLAPRVSSFAVGLRSLLDP